MTAMPLLRQAVAEEMKSLTPDLDPYKDGLKIYTTVDSRMQKYAEEAVRETNAQCAEELRIALGKPGSLGE